MNNLRLFEEKKLIILFVASTQKRTHSKVTFTKSLLTRLITRKDLFFFPKTWNECYILEGVEIVIFGCTMFNSKKDLFIITKRCFNLNQNTLRNQNELSQIQFQIISRFYCKYHKNKT